MKRIRRRPKSKKLFDSGDNTNEAKPETLTLEQFDEEELPPPPSAVVADAPVDESEPEARGQTVFYGEAAESEKPPAKSFVLYSEIAKYAEPVLNVSRNTGRAPK